jgi:hypothetical protein
MKKTSSIIIGIVLILFGIALILRQYHFFNFYYIKSYGLFLVGILFLAQGFSHSSTPRIYFSSVITLIGLYYIFDSLGIMYAYRELSISIYVLIFGLAFYPIFIMGKKKLNYLLIGNLLTLIGLMFLFWHLEIIDHNFLIHLIDNYWPLVIIFLGLIFLIGSFQFPQKKSGKVN